MKTTILWNSLMDCLALCTFWAALVLACSPGLAWSGEMESDAAKQIAEMVQGSRRAARERGDVKESMAIWTDDAVIVFGRGAKPGKYEQVSTRKQFEAVVKLKYRVPPKATKLEFTDVSVEITGKDAILRMRTTIKEGTGYFTMGEIYRLRQTATGWKAYESRNWPLEEGDGKETVRYTPDVWAERDRRVEEARDKGRREYVAALLDAVRPTEAHRQAKLLTEADGKLAQYWVLRGYAALECGDVEDALASFQRVLKIAPDAKVPDFIRAK